MTMIVALRARGQTEVHQMRDGSLALAAVGGTHGELCRKSSQRSDPNDQKRPIAYRFRNSILIR